MFLYSQKASVKDSKKNEVILGPVIFRCQPRRVVDYIADIERSRFFYYFNPFFFVVLSIVAFALLSYLFGMAEPLINRPGWTIVMSLFCVMGIGTGVWWYQISPKKDYLVVYENGFKWRVKLCIWNHFPSKGSVLFGDIEQIDYRADWQGKDFEEGQPDGEDNLSDIIMDIFFPKRDLRLIFKDGRVKTLGNIMKRFADEDIRRFIDYVDQKCPV